MQGERQTATNTIVGAGPAPHLYGYEPTHIPTAGRPIKTQAQVKLRQQENEFMLKHFGKKLPPWFPRFKDDSPITHTYRQPNKETRGT